MQKDSPPQGTSPMREQRFFGRRLRVVCEPDAAGFHLPVELTIGDDVIRVVEVLRQWQDSGFASTSRQRTWLERHHRTHYRVRGDDGRIYELYVDRTGGRRDWYLSKRGARADEPQGVPQPPGRERTGA
jgi:hypothetical protein